MNPASASTRRAVAADAPAFARIMSNASADGGSMQMRYPAADRGRTLLAEQSQPGRHDRGRRGVDALSTARLHPDPPTAPRP